MARWRILENTDTPTNKKKSRWLKAEAEPTVRGRNYQANRSLKAAHFIMCDGKNRANDTEKYATQKCIQPLRNTGTFVHYKSIRISDRLAIER